jgi:5-dehydro-4-deoxyglucarate dehydratase
MIKPEELRAKYGGVVAFPVTPFLDDLSLDIEGLRHNLTQLMNHPISAVVATGGTGEIYSLTPGEQAQVVETTVEIVNGRTPVIVGVGFNRMMAVEMAERAAASGADAILALPPYYPQADEEGLVEYYRAIGDATDLGMLIYSRDWANFSPAQVERLAAKIPTLVGWKDGQADLRRLQMIIDRVGDRLHWIGGAGDDMVPGYYSIGIRTYTSSIATVAPKLSLALHDAAANGRSEELSQLMSDCVIPLYALRARRKGYEVSAMKAMMDMVGLRGGPVRPPLPDVRAEEREELRAMLEKWKPFLV